MRVRIQDINGDYSFGNGSKNFYKDSPDGVAQIVKTRLLLWVNEWFLNIDDGTPWLQGVIGKQQLSTVDSIIRDRILNTDGVTGISDYTSTINPDNRSLFISATIDTLYGTTTLQAAL